MSDCARLKKTACFFPPLVSAAAEMVLALSARLSPPARLFGSQHLPYSLSVSQYHSAGAHFVVRSLHTHTLCWCLDYLWFRCAHRVCYLALSSRHQLRLTSCSSATTPINRKKSGKTKIVLILITHFYSARTLFSAPSESLSSVDIYLDFVCSKVHGCLLCCDVSSAQNKAG